MSKIRTIGDLITYLEQYSNDTQVRVCKKNGIRWELVTVNPTYLRKRDIMVFQLTDKEESNKKDE